MGNLREKVIKGLEHCMGDQPCEECPYETCWKSYLTKCMEELDERVAIMEEDKHG